MTDAERIASIPVLPARRDWIYLVVWCDHCCRGHSHGTCSGDPNCPTMRTYGRRACTCRPGSGDGHRVAHCHRRDSPYSKTGYIVRETSEPQRLRWRRGVPGSRLPSHAKLAGRPSRWGNPYPVERYGRDEAIRLYREHLRARPELVAAIRRELAGYDLACYCPLDEECHADVLLHVAAGGDP